MTIRLGTSGWQYRQWRERFYPRELPTERWLGAFAGWLDERGRMPTRTPDLGRG